MSALRYCARVVSKNPGKLFDSRNMEDGWNSSKLNSLVDRFNQCKILTKKYSKKKNI